MIKIIDNKKVEMTNDEYSMFEKICQSYDNPPSMRGKDLFQGLFETDEEGLIIYLIPPHSKMSSMEVYLFLMSLMQNQHLRKGYKLIDAKLAEMNKKIDDKLAEMKAADDKPKS